MWSFPAEWQLCGGERVEYEVRQPFEIVQVNTGSRRIRVIARRTREPPLSTICNVYTAGNAAEYGSVFAASSP